MEALFSFSLQICILSAYHRLTRASTVLTGRNAPILRQAPWQYGKYYLRVFSCLDTFLLRPNCFAPVSDGFSSDFWFLRRGLAGASQGEKDKKRRKDTLSGVFALVNRWYYAHLQRTKHRKRPCIVRDAGPFISSHRVLSHRRKQRRNILQLLQGMELTQQPFSCLYWE